MVYLDPSRQAEAVEAGWLAYAERVPGMESGYRRAISSWLAVAVCSGREVIGCLMARDGVIHLGIVPQWRGRWASRRVIREMLAYGTKTEAGPQEADFLQRVRACHS